MTVLGKYCTPHDGGISALRERDPRLWHEFGFTSGDQTGSGFGVTPDVALQIAAYYDAIRIISEDIAKVPLITYRRLQPRGKERAPTHPVSALLQKSSNRNMSAFSFREALTSHALGWGSGYAFIRRESGVPVELDLIHPSRVESNFTPSGDLFYMVKMPQGNVVTITQFNMFHLHGLSADGVNGYSVARIGAESLGRALAQQQFGASFFRSGSSAMGAIKHPMQLEEDQKVRLRNQWQETYAGPAGWHKPLILEEGMEWQQISIPPEDAQLLESENFSVLEIARWFRIAPHKLAHMENATFSNIEEQNIDHVTDTLMPWFERWEEEADRKLFVEDEDEFFAEHLLNALLRGNAEARSTLYRELWHIGVFSQNDIRELENLNPISDGDTYYVPMNVSRSEDAASGDAAKDQATTLDNRDDGNDNQPRDFSAKANAMAVSLGCAMLKLQARERKRVEYLIKKGHSGAALNERVAEFYEKHAPIIVNDLQPLVDAAVDLRGSPCLVMLSSIVACYVKDVCSAKEGADYFVAIEKEGALLVKLIIDNVFGKEPSNGVQN